VRRISVMFPYLHTARFSVSELGDNGASIFLTALIHAIRSINVAKSWIRASLDAFMKSHANSSKRPATR